MISKDVYRSNNWVSQVNAFSVWSSLKSLQLLTYSFNTKLERSQRSYPPKSANQPSVKTSEIPTNQDVTPSAVSSGISARSTKGVPPKKLTLQLSNGNNPESVYA